MPRVTIIGTGNMGQAIAGVMSKGGAEVDLVTRDGDIQGDVVVLAIPYAAIDDVVASYGEALKGKVVVDITNPVDFATFDSLTVPADSSAAADIAGRLPDSKVVKAFNTTFAGTVQSGKTGDQATTVFLAGDDEEAKKAVGDLVTAGGLKTLDVGSLRRARELEALGFLQMTLAIGEKLPWTGGLSVVS